MFGEPSLRPLHFLSEHTFPTCRTIGEEHQFTREESCLLQVDAVSELMNTVCLVAGFEAVQLRHFIKKLDSLPVA